MQCVAGRGAAPRNDADLVDRVGSFAVGGDQRVADLLMGHATFLCVAQAMALEFRSIPKCQLAIETTEPTQTRVSSSSAVGKQLPLSYMKEFQWRVFEQ